MSGWSPCTCQGTRKERMKNWYVTVYKANYSYFERPKGQRHPSEYSTVKCSKCTMVIRTKSEYVHGLLYKPRGTI